MLSICFWSVLLSVVFFILIHTIYHHFTTFVSFCMCMCLCIDTIMVFIRRLSPDDRSYFLSLSFDLPHYILFFRFFFQISLKEEFRKMFDIHRVLLTVKHFFGLSLSFHFILQNNTEINGILL